MADAPPLVLFAHPADPAQVDRARHILGDTAEVHGLPEDDAARREALKRAEVLLVTAWRIPEEEIHLLRRLRFVQRIWAGVESLPFAKILDTAPKAHFASNPGPNAPQVAEHALGLYLDCARWLTLRDRALRRGEWSQEEPQGSRVAGSTVAVLGLGAIGSRIARAFTALGARVIGVNRSGTYDDPVVCPEATTLDDIRGRLGSLDGMILSLPLTKHTQGLVDEDWLVAMKDDAILVNVARGKIVDEAALYAHLVTNPTFQAGIDVWWHYPKEGARFRQDYPFEQLDNVVMTPHSAYNVPGVHDETLRAACENVRRWLTTGTARHEEDAGDYL